MNTSGYGGYPFYVVVAAAEEEDIAHCHHVHPTGDGGNVGTRLPRSCVIHAARDVVGPHMEYPIRTRIPIRFRLVLVRVCPAKNARVGNERARVGTSSLWRRVDLPHMGLFVL